MSKVTVRALDTFTHNRRNPAMGDEFPLGRAEADELAAVGLVEIVGDTDEEDDLVSIKAAPITSNKMEAAPANKSGAKPKQG